jgi:hypothetical protein
LPPLFSAEESYLRAGLRVRAASSDLYVAAVYQVMLDQVMMRMRPDPS